MWQYIESVDELNNKLKRFKEAKVIGVDTETTGLNPHLSKVRLLQLAIEGEEVLIIDCFKILPEGRELLTDILTSEAVKVFQNAKFDLQFLKACGIEVSGKLFDTMIAARLLRTSGGPLRAGLGEISKHYLGYELSKEEQTSDFSGKLSDNQLEYAAKDALVLLELRDLMIKDLVDNKLVEVARLEFSCVYAIAYIEYHGIHLNMIKWQKLTKEVEDEQSAVLENLYPYIGYPTVQLGIFESVESNAVNLNSNKQVLELLSEHGIDLPDTSKYSLSKHLDKPIVKLILDYRHTNKALTSFLYAMKAMINPVTGRLHPHYGQIGAYSGRMSCGNPNIQQIPREMRFRECFTAPEGRKLVIADYSQIELRVMAQYSKDRRMIEAYRSGEDLHRLTASLVLQKDIGDISKSERQAAKAVNFGLIFGMGAAGLKAYAADSYHAEMTLKEAELFRKRYFEAYKGVERWQRRIKNELPAEDRTLSGRKFLFRKDSGLSVRFNAPIQGTAADILKNALGNLYQALKDRDTYIVAIVHDEIVLECPENDADEISKILSRVMEESGARYLKDVPVKAEASISDSWAGK